MVLVQSSVRLGFGALSIALLSACGTGSSSGASGTGGSAAGREMSMGAAPTVAGQGGASASTGGMAGAASMTDAAVAPAPGGGAGSSGTNSADGGAINSAVGGSAGDAGGMGGSGASAACTRESLKSAIDAYFEALAAHDPSGLPIASNVKFTENGKLAKLGEEGLWKTAGAVKYAHSALDIETCSSASQAVVSEGSTDIPLALRLKIQNQEITEIETIAVRPGDYRFAGQSFASNTAALIASGTTVAWDEPVPDAQRNARAELEGWMDKYFRMFPRGVCDTTSDCKRIENGGGSFACSAGASCDPGPPSAAQSALLPRLIFADVETGLGVGFTMFMGNTDMHVFKMYGDQVHGVSAILGAAGSSGWD
jgi:hypothetical protein